MSTSRDPSQPLLHSARYATVANDITIETGPWPGMSQRAKLIARALGLILVAVWLAVTDARLLVAVALALPIWIGLELALLRRRHGRAVQGARLLLWRTTGSRHSDPGGRPAPKAA